MTIITTKLDLLTDLPDACGVPTLAWYNHLEGIDHFLSAARHQTFVEPFDFQKEKDKIIEWIRQAKSNKELLEKLLPAAAETDPPALGRIRRFLRTMNDELAKALRGYPIGQFNEDDLRGIIDVITRTKFYIVHLLLPVILGAPFGTWYEVLEYIDWAVNRAAEESYKRPPNKESIKRFLELAKAQKDRLERELEH